MPERRYGYRSRPEMEGYDGQAKRPGEEPRPEHGPIEVEGARRAWPLVEPQGPAAITDYGETIARWLYAGRRKEVAPKWSVTVLRPFYVDGFVADAFGVGQAWMTLVSGYDTSFYVGLSDQGCAVRSSTSTGIWDTIARAVAFFDSSPLAGAKVIAAAMLIHYNRTSAEYDTATGRTHEAIACLVQTQSDNVLVANRDEYILMRQSAVVITEKLRYIDFARSTGQATPSVIDISRIDLISSQIGGIIKIAFMANMDLTMVPAAWQSFKLYDLFQAVPSTTQITSPQLIMVVA